MTHSNSSTSSSEPGASPVSGRHVGGILVWTLLWLVLADLTVSRLFRPPGDPRVPPKSLVRYSEYGRSSEGKLRRMIRPTDHESAPITQTGWLGVGIAPTERRAASAPGRLLVAAYGQSFTRDLLGSVMKVDPRVECRYGGGPGAPLSHSFRLFQKDRHEHTASVVVLGLLASSLSRMTTLTSVTGGLEMSAPFTYPRYQVGPGGLTSIEPPVQDLAQFRSTLADPARWKAYRAFLATHDAAFNPLSFDQDWGDGFLIGRLVRRAIGLQSEAAFSARYHQPEGFVNRDGILDVARALITEFGRTVRADGRTPIVLLFDDKGYPGHLKAAFADTMANVQIPFLASDDVAPATDLHNFISDGHFTEPAYHRIALRFVEKLRDLGLLSGAGPPSGP